MFQKIAKQRANDASLTMHRPPLLPEALVGSQEPWLVGSQGPWLAPAHPHILSV